MKSEAIAGSIIPVVAGVLAMVGVLNNAAQPEDAGVAVVETAGVDWRTIQPGAIVEILQPWPSQINGWFDRQDPPPTFEPTTGGMAALVWVVEPERVVVAWRWTNEQVYGIVEFSAAHADSCEWHVLERSQQ
jgi:hypothetical protein